VPFTRADLKEGVLIAAAVFVVALLLALLLVYVLFRLQQVGATDEPPSPKLRALIAGMLAARQNSPQGHMQWPG
jgi:hypothetical protein